MSKNQLRAMNRKINLLIRDGNTCLYCEKTIVDKDDCTIEHVLPRAQGGTNHLDNLAICCLRCNAEKGSLLLTQYVKGFDIVITKRIDSYL